MNSPSEILADLQTLQALCRDALTLAEKECEQLRADATPVLTEVYTARRALLPQLTESLERLRRHRQAWQELPAPERARYPEVGAALQQTQNIIMRVIVLDRENEQNLLRRGLVPAREMAVVQSQRPQAAARAYRQAGSSANLIKA